MGAVYRFEASGTEWQWRGKWLPNPGTDDCFFGAAIAIDGDRAAVGSPREDTSGPWSGAVYVDDIAHDCPTDVTGDVLIGVDDVLAIVSNWGPCAGCPEDVDASGDVGTDDLLTTIAAWGWCR